MYKLTFDEKPEANTYVKWARGKGYTVEGPYKEKLAKTAKKKFDLNGKPKKYAFAVLRQRGAGYEGGTIPPQHNVSHARPATRSYKGGYLPSQRRVPIKEQDIRPHSVHHAPATDIPVADVQPTTTPPEPTRIVYPSPVELLIEPTSKMTEQEYARLFPKSYADYKAEVAAGHATMAPWGARPSEEVQEYLNQLAKKEPAQPVTVTPYDSVSVSATFPLVPPAGGNGHYDPSGSYFYMNGKWWDFKAPGTGMQQEINPATGKLVNPAPAGAPPAIPTADYSEHPQTPLPPSGTPEGNYAQANPSKYRLYLVRKTAGSKETAPWLPAGTAPEGIKAQLGTLEQTGTIKRILQYDVATKKWSSWFSEGGPTSSIAKLVPGQWYAIDIARAVNIPALGGKLSPGLYSIKWSDALGDSAVQIFGTEQLPHGGGPTTAYSVSGKGNQIFKAIAGGEAAPIGNMVDNPAKGRSIPKLQQWQVINPGGTLQQYNTYIKDKWYTPGYMAPRYRDWLRNNTGGTQEKYMLYVGRDWWEPGYITTEEWQKLINDTLYPQPDNWTYW